MLFFGLEWAALLGVCYIVGFIGFGIKHVMINKNDAYIYDKDNFGNVGK